MNKLLTVLSIASVAFTNIFFTVNAVAEPATKASAVFEKMKTLSGTWKVKGKENSKFSIQFELTANNSVLVETWLRGEKKHSYTMYHLDNGKLLATHYCPQGNQPRLRLSDDSTKQTMAFNFYDATNLKSQKHSHQHSLGFEFSGVNDQITRKESYLSEKGENFSSLALVRLSGKPD